MAAPGAYLSPRREEPPTPKLPLPGASAGRLQLCCYFWRSRLLHPKCAPTLNSSAALARRAMANSGARTSGSPVSLRSAFATQRVARLHRTFRKQRSRKTANARSAVHGTLQKDHFCNTRAASKQLRLLIQILVRLRGFDSVEPGHRQIEPFAAQD